MADLPNIYSMKWLRIHDTGPQGFPTNPHHLYYVYNKKTCDLIGMIGWEQRCGKHTFGPMQGISFDVEALKEVCEFIDALSKEKTHEKFAPKSM